jgi:hypothetical protein
LHLKALILIGLPQCGQSLVFVFVDIIINPILYSPVPQAGEKEYWGTSRLSLVILISDVNKKTKG